MGTPPPTTRTRRPRRRRPHCPRQRAPAHPPRRSADAPQPRLPSYTERNGRVKERRTAQLPRTLHVSTFMRPSRNVILAAAALTVALLAVAFVPQLLGSEVRRALNGLSGARPIWLWVAGLCFISSIAGSAGAYRSAFGLVGGRLAPLDAAARYGIG